MMVAFMAFASQDVAAKSSKAAGETIPFDKLVTMIATGAHWSENNLTEIGLKKLCRDSYDEEFGEAVMFVYGNNVKAKMSKDWNVKLSSKGPHAYAIMVQLTTDNSTALYFKEKADHDAFMDCLRQSSYYSQGEYDEIIGECLIESDEYKNGWYVITFHVG
jgi:hypothetical protein